MTALIIIFSILAAVSLFMFFIKREEEKKLKKERKKVLEAEERAQLQAARDNPFHSLKVGDVVSYVGQDFVVQGKLVFREGSFEWTEYKLADASDVRWLEVELDDELWVGLYKEVDDLRIQGSEPPEEIEYRGDVYELEEKGYATMRREGDVGRRVLPECRYYDYEGSGDNILSIEQWGENFEVSVGVAVSPHALEIYPAAAA
jgi:hypothetical protein